MKMTNYDFLYGDGKKSIALESERIIKVVETTDFPVIENMQQAVLDAIYHPIGCAPLSAMVKPGQKIAFICNDPTRVANSFVFMPILVEELHKLGIKDEDMRLPPSCRGNYVG